MISDYPTYAGLVNAPYQIEYEQKSSITTVQGRTYSLWATAQDAGAAPTVSAVPTNATTGTFKQFDSATRQSLALTGMDLGNPGAIIVCDRLVHQGGLSGVVIGGNVTNLPTSALTRYTSGSGVMAALEIYTQIGATGTTVTVSGIFSDGTLGVSPALTFGATGFREINRFMILPMPAGKTGWQQVTNVNILATTGTAGNFGVTLFKPLAIYFDLSPGMQFIYDSIIGGGGNIPFIPNTSALFMLVISNAVTSGALTSRHVFIEG